MIKEISAPNFREVIPDTCIMCKHVLCTDHVMCLRTFECTRYKINLTYGNASCKETVCDDFNKRDGELNTIESELLKEQNAYFRKRND